KARVQAGAAEDARVVGREDAQHEVLVEVVAAAEAAQPLVDDVERLRLVRRPRHPRAQVREAPVDGVLEERRVLRLPAAQDEPVSLEPVGGRHRVTPPFNTVPYNTSPCA